MRSIQIKKAALCAFSCIVMVLSGCVTTEAPGPYADRQVSYEYLIHDYYTEVETVTTETLTNKQGICFSIDIKGNSDNRVYLTGLRTDKVYYEYANEFNDSFIYTVHILKEQIFFGKGLSVMKDAVADIHIYANEPFSSQYASGDDVSSLFDLAYFDVKAFIDNGYKCLDGGTDTYIDYCPTIQSLSNVDLSTKRLIACYNWIQLKQMPEKEGDYSFTIVVNCTDGKVVTTTTPSVHIVP